VIIEAAKAGLCITVFPKMDIMTFKEIIYLPKIVKTEYMIWSANSLAYEENAHVAE